MDVPALIVQINVIRSNPQTWRLNAGLCNLATVEIRHGDVSALLFIPQFLSDVWKEAR
jgi:hypothetical protein